MLPISSAMAVAAVTLASLALAACAQAPAAPAASATTAAPVAVATTSAAATAAGSAAAARPVAPAGRVVASVTPFTSSYSTMLTGGSGQRAQFFWPAFDGLTWVDRQGKLQPALASAWQTTDARRWSFTLRSDVRFHDGALLEAADVLATFQYYASPENRAESLPIFADVATMSAPDARTIVFELKQPVPTFAKLVALAMVVKGRDLARLGPQEYFKTAVGTGPYKFVSFQERVSITYQAMGETYVSARGVPRVKDLVMRDIPEVSTAVAALRAGEIQIAYPINADVLDQVRGAGFDVRIDRGSAQNHLIMNTEEAPFNDLRVRQAVNHAINRDAILTNVLGGMGEKIETMIGDDVLGFNPDVKGYAYDVNRARQLMAEAGQAAGFRVPLTYTPTVGVNVGSALAADLARIGVQVDQQQIESALWSQLYRGTPDKRPGLFQGTTNWEQTFEPDPVWRWWSSDIAVSGGRRWNDQQFDALYQRAKTTLDERQRGDAYKLVGKYLSDTAPVIFLWRNYRPAGVAKTVDWQPGLFADALVGGLSLK